MIFLKKPIRKIKNSQKISFASFYSLWSSEFHNKVPAEQKVKGLGYCQMKTKSKTFQSKLFHYDERNYVAKKNN